MSDHFETFCMKGLSGIGFAQINYGKYQVTLKPFGDHFINALGESIQKIFQQFLHAYRITYYTRHKSPHTCTLNNYWKAFCKLSSIKILKRNTRNFLKSRQHSPEFCFSIVAGFHLASSLKNVNSSFTSILQRDYLEFESIYFRMVTFFKPV